MQDKNIISTVESQKYFEEYKNLFVQRIPRYIVKRQGEKGWDTIHATLHDSEILKHLSGEKIIGVLGRWYPAAAILDMDDKSRSEVEAIRASLSLTDSNSCLCTSPSLNSYHTLVRTTYNGRPPTINLLQTVLKNHAKALGFELYPQRNRGIRLPFGKGQHCLDLGDHYFENWEQELAHLLKKDDFDLSTVKGHQTFFEFQPMDKKIITPAELMLQVDVPVLLSNGLQGPSTRDWAQFELVKHLWRQNVTRDDAWRFIWAWLCKHHNGFSNDFLKYPRVVQEHIRHQVTQYYGKMEYFFTLPDRPHLNHKGFISKSDLIEIVKVSEGRLPRMRFIFELIKYMNPRRYREWVPVHSIHFIDWSARDTYRKHLQYLDEKGILKRGSGYLVGQRSKGIRLNWDYKTDQEAVLFDSRAVETLEEAVKMVFKPAEFRALLRGYVSNQASHFTTKTLFDISRK